MKKQILLQLIFLLFASIAFSQITLNGKVVDENEDALSFATIALIHPSDSTLLFFGVTKDYGTFQIKRVKKGSYLMQYSFVGMQTAY